MHVKNSGNCSFLEMSVLYIRQTRRKPKCTQQNRRQIDGQRNGREKGHGGKKKSAPGRRSKEQKDFFCKKKSFPLLYCPCLSKTKLPSGKEEGGEGEREELLQLSAVAIAAMTFLRG